MTKQEKIEGNTLIFEFMNPDKINYIKRCYGINYYPKYCWRRGYHGNWNALMKVVEKIGGIDNRSVAIHWGTGCTDSFAWCIIKDGGYHIAGSDSVENEQNLIGSVYEAVIKFIKWYNKNEEK